MNSRSYKVVFAAVVCLVVAWSVLFAGNILGFESASEVPAWVILALLAASGVLAAWSRRSTRTRIGVGLAIVLTAAGLASVHVSRRDAAGLEQRWWRDESGAITTTLLAAGQEIARLESISESAGERATAYVRQRDFRGDGDPLSDRLDTFEMFESLAQGVTASGELPPGTEIGMQLFDARGERVAWAGWPQPVGRLDRAYMESGVELVYSREVSLYRILTRQVPVTGEGGERVGTVVVDLPLEVNYRVNNRFLKSAGLADNIPADRVADIAFEYSPALTSLPYRLDRFKQIQNQNLERRERMFKQRQARERGADNAVTDEEDADAEGQPPDGAERRGLATKDSVLSYFPFPPYIEPTSEITGGKTTGLQGRVLVRSPQGNPIVSVTASGHPFRHFTDRYRSRWLTWAKSYSVLALLVLFVIAMLALGRRGYHAWLRGGVFIGFLVLLRFSLLSFKTFSTGGGKIFDPTVFATPLLGGILRSSGDLLITGTFYVIALYGLMKMIRSKDVGEHPGAADGDTTGPSHPAGGSRKPGRWEFLAKGIVIVGAIYAVYWLARGFSEVVVVNANPRLIGETMRLTDTSVVVLHLGTFLTLTGIILTGMLVVWGMFRLTGWGDAVRSAWTGFLLLAVAALVFGPWELAPIAGLLLLFVVFAPRYVRREELVSIAIVSFCLVIITSGLTYLFFSRDYDELRKSNLRDKANEMVTPSDNWKVVILEDILDEYSHTPRIQRAILYPESADAHRLAFDLWADGPLSLLGYSCAIHVLTARDSVISDFAVDMPYRLRLHEGGERIDTPVENDWVVLDLTRSTPQGIVRFYRGVVNVEEERRAADGSVLGEQIGKIVVDLPFFFESLQWAARTGPRTPEVLRNVQEGGVAPRVEEPEALLLARLDGRRINESSSESLPVGITIPEDRFRRGLEARWPLLKTEGGSYRLLIQPTKEPGRYLLAGFAVPSPARHAIRWSTLFSLYLFFTASIIVAIIVLSTIPYVKELLPTLTPGRKLGFQQKLLASFLVVALVPAVILGLFSADFIENRFVDENRRDAVERLYSARKALVNLLHGEMQLYLAQVDPERLFTEEGYASASVTGGRLVVVIGESGAVGPVRVDETGHRVEVAGPPAGGARDGNVAAADSLFNGRRPTVDLSAASTEDLYMLRANGTSYVGVLSPPTQVSGEGWVEDYYVYYSRRVDAQLLGDVADQISADVNVFDKSGDLVASSQEGLLAGGLIPAIINSDAYVKVSLLGSNQALATEKAGRYSYQVAYLPVTSWGVFGRGPTGDVSARGTGSVDVGGTGTPAGAEPERPVRAAMSVPLVFLPESYSIEIQKATSLVLGIFALLFVATIGLGLLLARGIFEPLRGLLEGTRRIIRGDLNVRLPMRRTDEIGIVVSAFNEMTEQLSGSQRALEERRRYLETILANIGTGVISTDADDRIRTVNSAAERILGIEARAAMGKTAAEMADESRAPEIFKILRDGRDARKSFIASEVELQRDGRRATVKYMLTQLNVDGRYLGTVFVFEDLTELIQTKKLSAWIEMARQIAHEIKNPLTPIRISTQFMQRAYDQKSEKFDQIFKESSETIIQQVDVLKRIASEFSSYGRMQQLDLAPRKLAPLLGNIVEPYRRNSTGVEVELDNGVPDAVVLVDTEAVRKICTNLIENAMDAMPEGGELNVACREEDLDDERYIRVSFRDTGPGLSDEVSEKLFEPYFSTKTTGTGLGLAICRSLSQEMGGDIDVRNVSGGGVEASVLLRIAP
jgi:PAS domain S-box-containing protein